jgi:hypothetical protein
MPELVLHTYVNMVFVDNFNKIETNKFNGQSIYLASSNQKLEEKYH